MPENYTLKKQNLFWAKDIVEKNQTYLNLRSYQMFIFGQKMIATWKY